MVPAVVAVLLAGALINPRMLDKNAANASMQGYEIAVALDVSNSMMATDLPPSRLQQATLLMQMLLDTLKGSRVSFTAFAGEAFLQLPLTTDLQGARSIFESISPEMVPVQGTSLAKALLQAGESFDAAPANYKALIMLTDGETHDEESIAAADALKEKGVMLIAIGIGSENGATIKDAFGFPIRDPESNETVVSKLNEELLVELAAVTSGEYHRFTNVNETLAAVMNDLNNMDKKPLASYAAMNFHSYAFWLLGAALVLLMLPRWRINFAGVNKAAATALIVLQLLGTATAQQKELNDARQLYQQGEVDKAGALFNKVLQKQPNNALASYYLGAIAYRNEQFEEAATYFDQSRAYLQQNKEKANAANNQGIALAKSGKKEEAVTMLKEALKRNPFDKEIQHNLNVALKQQQQQQQDQPPPPPPPKKQKQNDDKLKALEEEEKKTREKQIERKAKGNNQKNW